MPLHGLELAGYPCTLDENIGTQLVKRYINIDELIT